MSGPPHVILERQVYRVRRRLFIQACLNRLAVAWTVALAGFAVWLLARPYVFAGAAPWMDWAVGGTFLVAATAWGIWRAVRLTPNATQAALHLDERFGLRERVTTSLTLAPSMIATPAGQALLADASTRAAGLNVREKFPVKMGWISALVPVAAAMVVAIAMFYQPVVNMAHGGDASVTPVDPQIAKELEQKKNEFLNRPKAPPKPDSPPKPEDLQRLDAKLEEILKRPLDTKKDIKERLAELTPLEEQLRKKYRDLAEKAQSLEDQLAKLDKRDKDKGDKEQGLSKKFREALADNDFKEAKNEVERLSKKLKNNELKPDEQAQLQREMDNLKKDLEHLGKELEAKDEQKRLEREQKLEEQFREGKIDKNELDREKKKLDDERKNNQSELKQLSDKLDRVQKALEKGDKDAAAEALSDVAEEMNKLEEREAELDEREAELEKLQSLRDAMCKGSREGQEGDADILTRKNGECDGL